jgi:CheY-like chemotaxis protein
VAARLRADPRHRHAVLVALTGWGAEEDRRRTREAGFDLHLVKPVDPEAIARVVAQR